MGGKEPFGKTLSIRAQPSENVKDSHNKHTLRKATLSE
jgi:hypothetical protein